MQNLRSKKFFSFYYKIECLTLNIKCYYANEFSRNPSNKITKIVI